MSRVKNIEIMLETVREMYKLNYKCRPNTVTAEFSNKIAKAKC
jgi:hypothetical protein